jgi:uncharacterized protein YoxC
MAGSSQLRNFNINIERRIHMVLLISFIVNVAQAIIIMLLIKDYKKLEEMWFQLANKVSALKYQVREMHNEKERILEEMDELKNENSNFMVEK